MRYAKYLKGAWLYAALAPALMIMEVVADLYQPAIMRDIVDTGIMGGAGTPYIIQKGARMLLIALLGAAGGIGCSICSTTASMRFGYNLRNALFGKIQTFSFRNIDKFSGASLVIRLTADIVVLQTVAAMALRLLVRAPATFVGGIARAVMINARLALILAVAVPLIFLILWGTLKKSFPLFKQVQKKLDRLNAVIQENLTGIRVVKAYDRAEHENARFGGANDNYAETAVKAQKIMAGMMPGVTFIMNLSVVGVLWFGAKLVGANRMQVGEVSAFITYITRILNSIMMMSMMFMMLSRAQVSSERVREVLDAEADITSPENPAAKEIKEGAIAFKNVSFRYEGAGGEPALSNLSFEVKKGETVAIIGSTGSGKSTLVNLIPRLYDVSGGEILIDGINVRDYDLDGLRGGIGMALQTVILFTGTIAENLRWGKENASEKEIAGAAKMAQAEEFIRNNPDGYEAVLGQRGVNFSGGQKQRLSIARALIKRPKILILDDSTSAVDTVTEARIRQALSKEMSDATVIIIAQRISSARGADKIIVMENGEMVAQGDHDYLMKNSGVYREIFDSQLEKEEA